LLIFASQILKLLNENKAVNKPPFIFSKYRKIKAFGILRR